VFVRTPTTRYAKTVDGVHIAYQVLGQGENDLVYAPGWISNVEANWDHGNYPELVHKLAALGRLIVFDRRGAGLSDRPDRVETLALELGMNDLRAVLDAAGSKRAAVFGYEDGGTLAAMFSAAFPELISALILYAPFAKGWPSSDYPFGDSDEEFEDWLRRVDEEWGTERFSRSLVAHGVPELAGDESFIESAARWLRSCASPGAVQAIDRMLRDVDAREVFQTISVPTLVLQRSGNPMRSVDEAKYIAGLIPGARFAELSGTADPPFVSDIDAIVQAIEAFLGRVSHEEADFDRHLASVLFTDIVGSTSHAAELGDRSWASLLERHHAIVRALLTRYRGTEVDTAGDGFFATFDGPARAVRCAQQIVEAVAPTGLEVRAGVHTGEVQMIDGKAGGVGVVIGARVGALAGPSEIMVSQTVRDLVAGSGLVFEDAGEHELKGVPDRWHLYRAVG
jgi:class 3 adenylate cyclase